MEDRNGRAAVGEAAVLTIDRRHIVVIPIPQCSLDHRTVIRAFCDSHKPESGILLMADGLKPTSQAKRVAQRS